MFTLCILVVLMTMASAWDRRSLIYRHYILLTLIKVIDNHAAPFKNNEQDNKYTNKIIYGHTINT